jgi:MFS transporter, ACS family, solute carrier family 17 (sodium-dependent inorganic phosphate cotransporter), other
MTLSLGFNGAATMTNLQNTQDLAPNYAGTLYGIINFVGTTSGFISPMIVAHFTENEVENEN